MNYQPLLAAAILTTGLAGALLAPGRAETISTDTGIAVKNTDINTPSRGMTMDQVASKFGTPANKIPPVGKPPISRWEYPGFVVYFEHEHVIHSVVAGSSGGEAAPAGGATLASEETPAPSEEPQASTASVAPGTPAPPAPPATSSN
jgi:hypothetical protein